MPVPKSKASMTVDEYLRFEEKGSTRHEYVNGQVFAMSGATNRHNIIAGNIHSILRAHVRGSNCRAYISDVKVRIKTSNSFYYPDVLVSCESYDRNSVYAEQPVLIVEVLSKSTAAVDRREKVTAYRQIASLREYLIVFQKEQRLELHRRQENDLWSVTEYGPGQELELQSIECGSITIHIDQIYEDVEFSHPDGFQVKEDSAEYWPDGDSIDW